MTYTVVFIPVVWGGFSEIALKSVHLCSLQFRRFIALFTVFLHI